MRSSNIILLVIVLLAVIFGVLFFVISDSEETENEGIDPIKYDKKGDNFTGKELCGGGDRKCQRDFNSYWYCDESLDKCVCTVTDELDPICGKDGKTYSSSSEANCAGVKMDYSGECTKITDKLNDCEFCQVANCQYGCVCGDDGIGGKCAEISSNDTCGNGVCNEGENSNNCPQDCASDGPTCGNGVCNEGENSNNCPQDCASDGPTCGNGVCNEGENSNNCPQDCASDDTCGNGVCELGEADIPGGCEEFAEEFCLGPPGQKGTCPQDCN